MGPQQRSGAHPLALPPVALIATACAYILVESAVDWPKER